MQIIENALFQIECAKLMGDIYIRVNLPESLHPWALKELTEVHHLICKFKSIDNSSVYTEPQYIYDVFFKE
jgi:hypothetical protein